ncbi:hypothetical protein [Streptomyces sp. NPDC003943]
MTPTVAHARNVLIPLDYAYNIAAFVELAGHDYLSEGQVDIGYKILQEAAVTEITAANHALGSLISEGAQLVLRRMEAESPFCITVDGIADIIKELRACFSPTARKERKEGLRHQQEMNRLKEVDYTIDVQRKFDEYLASSPRFNKEELSRRIGETRADQLRYELSAEFVRSIEMGRSEGIISEEGGENSGEGE